MDSNRLYRYTCEIRGDMICETDGNGLLYTFLPFDYYYPGDSERKSIYIEFISLDETDEADILNFVNKYSILGVNIHSDEDTKHNGMEPNRSENLQDIKEAIILMRSALKYIDAMKLRDKEAMTESYLEFYDSISKYEWYRDYFDSFSDKYNRIANYYCQNEAIRLSKRNVKAFVKKEIQLYPYKNEYSDLWSSLDIFNYIDRYAALVRITPSFTNNRYEEIHAWTDCFQKQYYVPTLMSAMYFMLYEDISLSFVAKKCKSETCKKYFQVSIGNLRKEFCDTSCAKAQAQREYRRRKKTEKDL